MKETFEILHEYVKQIEDQKYYDQLGFYERVLLRLYYRDTIKFKIYLLKYRVKEIISILFNK